MRTTAFIAAALLAASPALADDPCRDYTAPEVSEVLDSADNLLTQSIAVRTQPLGATMFKIGTEQVRMSIRKSFEYRDTVDRKVIALGGSLAQCHDARRVIDDRAAALETRLEALP